MANKESRKAAAAKRAAAAVDHDEIITALKAEKAGYESRGLDDRAKAVQSQISKHERAAKDAAKATGSTSTGTSSGSQQRTPAAGSNTGSAKSPAGGGADPFDPKDHDVDDVVAHVAGADDTERARVIEAEKAGKNRSTLLAQLEQKG